MQCHLQGREDEGRTECGHHEVVGKTNRMERWEQKPDWQRLQNDPITTLLE